MLNFVLWLLFFSVSILTKILQFYPSWFFFCPHTDKHVAILSKRTFDTQSIHIFGLVLLFIYFPEQSILYQVLHIWKTIFCFVLSYCLQMEKLQFVNILFDFIQIFTFVKHIFGLVYYLSKIPPSVSTIILSGRTQSFVGLHS